MSISVVISSLDTQRKKTAADKLKDNKPKDTEMTYHHKCEAGDVFHFVGVRLNDAKSVEEFKTHTIALIRHVWLASLAQNMTPCIITAVSECLEACKKTALPVGPVGQFYNFRLEGKSLPAWIILHSPPDSDNASKPQVDTRLSLLQVFLTQIPLTEKIRDELYYACAIMGFNNFFKRVRVESLKQLEGLPSFPPLYEEYIEIGYGLRPSSVVESLKVDRIRSGFKVIWHVPGMLQKLETGSLVGIEFVAEGQIWGMYVRALNGRIDEQWEFMLAPLKPSQIDFKKNEVKVKVNFKVSRYEEGTFSNRESTKLKFPLVASSGMSTVELPKGNGTPQINTCWTISSPKAGGFHRCFNEDGSCYVRLTVCSDVL